MTESERISELVVILNQALLTPSPMRLCFELEGNVFGGSDTGEFQRLGDSRSYSGGRSTALSASDAEGFSSLMELWPEEPCPRLCFFLWELGLDEPSILHLQLLFSFHFLAGVEDVNLEAVLTHSWIRCQSQTGSLSKSWTTGSGPKHAPLASVRHV